MFNLMFLLQTETQPDKELAMIDHCNFGSMTIDGKRFTSDLFVFPEGRVADNWWRNEGHRLTENDLAAVIAAGPEIIVAGMGIYGRMKAAPGLAERLAAKGISLIAENTEPAAKTFNDLYDGVKRVAGCFHLTC